ncbi:MAG: DJ-1/PfpI family protein, partial [Gaiellaceae bacterium]
MAIEVLFAIFPQLALLDVVGPAEVFATTNQVLGRELYRSRAGAITGTPLVAGESGLELAVTVDLRRARTPDTLIVAGGTGYREAIADAELLAVLRRLAPRPRRLASVCTGAFVLAEIG